MSEKAKNPMSYFPNVPTELSGAVSYETLKQRQSWPLDLKIAFTETRIRQWYGHWGGNVYVSFSGGKDSTVLLDIVKRLYPDVPAVFCDTGLEYPEVRKFALSRADVVLKPEMPFNKIIEKYGYPVIGKKQARMIHDLQNESDSNRNVCNLYRTGYTVDGKHSPSFKMPEKWKFLVDAPFKISETCCDIMKKKPFASYERETGGKPIIGTMACESDARQASYLKLGCNAFNAKRQRSQPISIWTDQDVLAYIKDRGIEYAGCYGDIVCDQDGNLLTTREKRTGCMFCMFGIQFDGNPNRFQRMQRDYPKQYRYCMEQLGIGQVLDYIGIPKEYEPTIFDLERGEWNGSQD